VSYLKVSDAVFTELGDGRFLPGEPARGPWDPHAQHGGAPAALLARAFESADGGAEDLLLTRMTFEFVRPVPLAELVVEVSLVRPGRRVQLLEGSVRDADGAEVVRARALRVARTSVAGGDAAADAMPPGPERGRAGDLVVTDLAMFGTHAMEIRFVDGAFYDLGPATAWFRLRIPLVAGEQTSPLQRLAAAGDFGNGISSTLSWDTHLFINPDLTLYVEREPAGEWIGLESRTHVARGGVGVSESVLYDERGRVGRAVQALLVAER